MLFTGVCRSDYLFRFQTTLTSVAVTSALRMVKVVYWATDHRAATRYCAGLMVALVRISRPFTVFTGALADRRPEWCCPNVELCHSWQGQSNICDTRFISPNTTVQKELKSLGIESIATTLSYGDALVSASASPFTTVAFSEAFISSTSESTSIRAPSTSTPDAEVTTGSISDTPLPISTSNPANDKSDQDGLLGGGSIAGIVIGVLAAIAFGAIAAWLFLRWRTRTTRSAEEALPSYSAKESVPRHELSGTIRHEAPGKDRPVEAPGRNIRHEMG